MSSEKSVTIAPPAPKTLCPICGKATYSAGGIHPQCAMQQADAPRMSRLRAAKDAAPKPKPKKPAQRTWKKRCPVCGTDIHVRRSVCACGHDFTRT